MKIGNCEEQKQLSLELVLDFSPTVLVGWLKLQMNLVVVRFYVEFWHYISSITFSQLLIQIVILIINHIIYILCLIITFFLKFISIDKHILDKC